MRRSGVRIPLAPPQADIRSGCRFFVCLAWCCGACCCSALSPLVFRVSDVLFVPGCLVCPWAVVFLLLLIVAPTDLRPPRGLPARSPSAPRASLGASARSPARPRHRPPAPRPGPATDHGHRSLAPSLPTGTAVPSGPSGTLHTGGAWSLMCGSACRLEARPGPATAHGHHRLALTSLTGAAGNSRETVIAFAGVCSVSGETDGTIASQIHLILLLFHRAKASWVSWRRTEGPALVLAVSSCGAVSSMGATKFAQRRLSMAIV